ncbi:hypothetical protein D3C80_1758230 [compost metagenome]
MGLSPQEAFKNPCTMDAWRFGDGRLRESLRPDRAFDFFGVGGKILDGGAKTPRLGPPRYGRRSAAMGRSSGEGSIIIAFSKEELEPASPS